MVSLFTSKGILLIATFTRNLFKLTNILVSLDSELILLLSRHEMYDGTWRKFALRSFTSSVLDKEETSFSKAVELMHFKSIKGIMLGYVLLLKQPLK